MSRLELEKPRSSMFLSGKDPAANHSPQQLERIQHAQLDGVFELLNVMLLANLLNVAAITISLMGSSVTNLILIWAASMTVILAYIGACYHFAKSRDSNTLSAEKRKAGILRGAGVLGAMWGILALLTIPFLSGFELTAISVLITGVMFGGVIMIGRVPQVAVAFILPITIGVLVGLQILQDPGTLVLSFLMLIYSGLLYFTSKLAANEFVLQQVVKTALQEQTEVIGLLLHDFEESTSDWLWMTDARCMFIPVPSHNDETAGKQNTNMVGKSFQSILKDSSSSEEFLASLSKQAPFRDVTVAVTINGEIQWWSITGKPLFSHGEFMGYRGVATDVTQAKAAEDRLEFLAHFDALTKLPNRSHLADRLRSISNSSSTVDDQFVLVWLDLDNFKWVNDTLGHHAGDEVLKLVSDRMKIYFDDEGFVARISGDEFAVIFKYADHCDLVDRMDDFITKMSTPYEVWGSSVLCRASMGAKVLPSSAFDVNEMLKHADLALYSSKEREKGAWTLFDRKLEEKARSLREMEVDLNIAIERNELRLFFQPIVDSVTREVVACETLIRWQHPRRGLISPIEFIKFAEDSGLITRMGDWVLREALKEARYLPKHIRVAVNVSPLQIHSANLVPTIINALAANDIEPNRLELEITESVMITDTEFTIEKLRQLKELGLRIALDDFGTGFSSLSYLRQFPFDKLKIDRSFTEDLPNNSDSQEITKATLQLARALNMRCTGEGVETLQQADFLRDNGCDELQGYMFSRPMPLKDLKHLIDLKPDAEIQQSAKLVSMDDARQAKWTSQSKDEKRAVSE